MADHLPKQFRFSHDFSFYLHDLLAEMIVFGESKRHFDVKFKLRSEDHAVALDEMEDGGIFDLLERYGYTDIIGEMLLKQLFPALLSDFCHFICEALSASKRGKLTVTYALLRKPLRENLFYLEWLLADPEQLLNTFYSKPPADLTMEQAATPDKALDIIKKALDRIPNSDTYSPDFIYDLRYNRAAEFGFEQLWHKALHLVTTRQNWRTEPQNFNFVFSDDDSRLSQWYHLYTRLPYLLSYTVDICSMLMALILKEPLPKQTEAFFHRVAGFALWGIEVKSLGSGCEGPDENDITFSPLVLDCPKCRREILVSQPQLWELFNTRKTRCPSCRRKVTIADFAAMGSEKATA